MFLFALSLLLQLVSISVCEHPEVVLSTGRVRGQRLVSVANRRYYSFKGIPYAAPPVGQLRFKAPQPPDSWDGTLEAFDIPPACTQPHRYLKYPENYSEDCLYINVFTPYMNPPRDKLMPVMFWIHGGKHYQGSSTSLKYGADFLITEDVVLVTFNYRLGVFGYLSSQSESAQGNAALKDMVAALRWVRQEISKFGGDPDSVTIFGSSSGANDVNCLYLSPLASGLFHKAIAQSGAQCELVTLYNAVGLTSELAKEFGCTSSDPEETVACLRNIDAQELAEKQTQLVTPLPGQIENPFTMTVEEDHGEEIFMPEPPEDLLRVSNNRVPYMLGMNSGEGMMYVEDPSEHPTQFQDFSRNFELYIPTKIRANKNYRELLKIMKKLKKYYFKNNEISLKTVYGFINFMTDSKYTFFISRGATALSRRVPVYLYYFAFEGEFHIPRSTIIKLNLTGVNHGDELGYLFYRSAIVPKHKHIYKHPRECTTLSRMVRLWANFAKYGNPTPNQTDELLNVTWQPVSGYLTQHLVIEDSLHMETTNLLKERSALWESFWSLSSAEDEIFVAINIIAVILGLAMVSLIYLIYTSSCSKGYLVL